MMQGPPNTRFAPSSSRARTPSTIFVLPSVHAFNATTSKDCLAFLFHCITLLSFWSFVLRPSSFVAWRIQTSLFSFPHYYQRSACGTLVQQRLQIGTQSIFLRVPESEGNTSFKECIVYPKFWIRGSLTQIAAEQHQRHRSGDTASISKFPGESLSSFETILVSR
jgi:hypothetical protein